MNVLRALPAWARPLAAALADPKKVMLDAGGANTW
jgi:hypothetical protein